MGSTNKKIESWRVDTLRRDTKRALTFLSQQEWLKYTKWYLAGGTALALHAGHRQSFDHDFFTPSNNFSTTTLLKHFSKNQWTTDIAREGTVYGRLLDTRVSFISYPFFIPKKRFAWYGSVRVLHPQDVAVMKIIAISQRGKKRDFVDLYWCVHHGESLEGLLRLLPEQYPTVAHNYHHIIKSLMYFQDADQDPMPKLFFKASWRTIKQYFQREVPRITKEFLGLR